MTLNDFLASGLFNLAFKPPEPNLTNLIPLGFVSVLAAQPGT